MNTIICLAIVSLSLAALAGHCQEGGVMLVHEGQGRAVIVTADEPSPMAAYAAEELAAHIMKATGVELPVVRESNLPPAQADLHRVYVGVTEASAAQGIDPEALGPETFILRTVGRDLYVLGREEGPSALDNPWSGTLNGVYELLERVAGVRWLWPGELGTHVPQAATLVVERVDEVVAPATGHRTWHLPAHASRDPNLLAYLRRHRVNRSGLWPVGHTFSGWWQRLGQEHPEWFMLDAQGVRGGGGGTHVPICVSNRELQAHVVDEHWKGGEWLHVAEVDSTVFCHCEECEALDAPHPEDLDLSYVWMRRVLADRYAHFWKAVHERARRVNPDVKVTTYLYWQTFHAPLGEVELGPDFHGEFVQWMGKTMWFPMPDDALRHMQEQWLGWQRTGMTMAYRPNYFWGGYVLPFLSTRQAGEFLKFTYEHGSVGWRGDSMFGQWAIKGPMLYLHMRLTHDPGLDIDDLRAEYFSAFGPAAEAVERYFDYWEDFSHRVVENWSWPRWGLPQLVQAPRIFTAEVFAPAEAILDEAIEAARQHPGEAYAERVRFIRLGLDHAVATMTFVALLDDGEVVLHDRERFEATQAAWRDLQAMRTVRRDIAEPGTGLVLDYDIHVGRYLVTHDQYHAFCEATGRTKPVHHQARDKEDMGDHPITQNRWVDYVEYCNWLSEQAGLEPAYVRDDEARGGWVLRDAPERVEGYRMPLQHEWEYAAQGGARAEVATTYAGSDNVDEVAWHGNTAGLQPVGQLAPNALGLHDMSGLVNEWTNEGYMLGGSYWYGADRAVVYPAARRTNWGGELHERCGNQNWHSGLRVVRTAIGDGGETGERFPEMVLVEAGSTVGTLPPFVDLGHVAGSIERRYLKQLDTLEKDFEEVREDPPLEAPNPWSQWRFRMDPDNRGMEQGWQAVEFDEDDWRPIEAPAFWAQTWVGPYLGYGWYRTTFVVPGDWAGQQVNLDFGGVDEQGWVSVNGELVGEHTVDSEGMTVGQLWNRPFTIEIPAERLLPGEENTLVVRVHASMGNAGIHQPVVGHAPHPEQWRPLPER